MAAKYKRTAKHLACGLIPGFEKVLQIAGKEPCSGDRQLTQEQLEKILAKNEDCVQNFVDKYPSWLEERQECIQEIRQLADNIDFHHRNINVAQLPTSAVGVVGGILTITGLALIPVYLYGASIGLILLQELIMGS